MTEDKKLPYLTAPHDRLAISLTLAACKAGVSNKGVMISSTREDTIEPKAAPMITATAKLITFNHIN